MDRNHLKDVQQRFPKQDSYPIHMNSVSDPALPCWSLGLVFVSGPSGSGKTTLLRMITSNRPSIDRRRDASRRQVDFTTPWACVCGCLFLFLFLLVLDASWADIFGVCWFLDVFGADRVRVHFDSLFHVARY